ncbi:hypothetical protein HXX02_17145 [Microbulbifer elongatus]|uniref:C2H2-type domain-containing protein n=1 Tax=Microbulbifer elongatus TaxID=86173 RepID=A0ABT1P4Y4_9GAMM|nr:hypothetical protein [Microbulbifer elongatus]MCQ3831162.1 hypothetical protein [Microbulbifer elongatus]
MKEQKICPECEVSVRVDRFDQHMKKTHKLVHCDGCEMWIKTSHYYSHLKFNHPDMYRHRLEENAKKAEIRAERKEKLKQKITKKAKPKNHPRVVKVKKEPDGLPVHKSELGEIRRDYNVVQGGGFGLGKSRRH